jgi:signal transduction histidine kinase
LNDILIVDDEMANLKLLSEMLDREGYQVRPANNPLMAIDSTLAQPPKLILLDVKMPQVDGFEVCERLKEDERTRDIPIIFISALQDVQDKVRGFEVGGVDFISKPFQEEEVLARVRTHMELRNMQLTLEKIVDERTAELTATNKALEAETKEVTRQRDLNRTILSSLDSHLAVLDRDGEIIAINDAWRAFATANDVDSTEKIGVGANYFDVCRFAEIDDSERAIAGIGSVIDGTRARFDMVYDCHSPSEKRWFSMTVTPMKTERGGAVVMHTSITKRKQAERELQRHQQRLKALASQLAIVEEKERRAIAADLHDHVGQTLALARMQLASARNSTADTRLADKLDDISDTLLKSLEDTQQLMLELSYPAMHDTGLSGAVADWLESQIERKYRLKTEVIDHIPHHRRKTLAADVRTILFRNVRELIVNVLKHARASKVTVRLEDRPPSIRIIVEDDGVGFDWGAATQAVGKTGGFGLFSINELMADLGGSLRIVSEPGKGCTAILSAPFDVDRSQERD